MSSLLLATAVACANPETARDGGAGPVRAPDFTLESLSGQAVSLNDFRGSVVLVNLWATWCPPCKAEIPVLEAAYVAHQAQGLVILGVDTREAREAVAPFVASMGITYPVLLDEKGTTMQRFRAVGLPTSILVDRDGNVRERHQGDLSQAELSRWLEMWLKP